MPSEITLPNSAQQLLALIVERELIGCEEPSISLAELRPRLADSQPNYEDLLCDAAHMSAYLSTELESRGSHLRVEPVEVFYFDFSPYSGRMDRACYLALVDPQVNTRKLFVLSATKPAIEWRPEQNSGPVFERARLFHLGVPRQRSLRKEAEAASFAFLTPIAEKVRLYVESRALTAEQAYDLEQVTNYTKWNKMELESLIYIALALGTTLEEIIASDVTVA